MVVQILRNDSLSCHQVDKSSVELATALHNRVGDVVSIDNVVVGLNRIVSVLVELDVALSALVGAIAKSRTSLAFSKVGALAGVGELEGRSFQVQAVVLALDTVWRLTELLVLLLEPVAHVAHRVEVSERRWVVAHLMGGHFSDQHCGVRLNYSLKLI